MCNWRSSNIFHAFVFCLDMIQHFDELVSDYVEYRKNSHCDSMKSLGLLVGSILCGVVGKFKFGMFNLYSIPKR